MSCFSSKCAGKLPLLPEGISAPLKAPSPGLPVAKPGIVASLFTRLNQLSVLQEANVNLFTRTYSGGNAAHTTWTCDEHPGPFPLSNVHPKYLLDVVDTEENRLPGRKLSINARNRLLLHSFNRSEGRPAHLPRRRRGSLDLGDNEPADIAQLHIDDMDPAQISNRNAASQYLFLVDQARNADLVVKVINDMLSDKGVYAFAELYAKEQVQKLKSTEASIWLTVLEIFMWGTYEHYEQTPSKPNLNDAQKHKLRMLSLLSFASQPAVSSVINREEQQLYIPTVRQKLSLKADIEVDRIFIAAKEQNLLDGSIDKANKMLEIKAIYPARDLNPTEMGEMSRLLGLWISNVERELVQVGKKMEDIQTEAKEKRRTEAEELEKFEKAIEDSNKNNRKRGGAEGLDPGVGSSRNIRPR